jgi:hypothetical protein
VDEPSIRISVELAAGADVSAVAGVEAAVSEFVPPQADRNRAAGITIAATLRLKRGICLCPFGRRTSHLIQSKQTWKTNTYLKVNAE